MSSASFLATRSADAAASRYQWKPAGSPHFFSFSDEDDFGWKEEAHGTHPHVALLFPFVTLLFGALTTGFLSRCLPSLPYTVVMLIEGFFVGLYEQSNRFDRGLFSQSLFMWANMDPHLLLFAFLPALLFADSMSLNWHMWKKCLGQCLLLAGPGVLIGTGMAAVFAKYVLPYEWSWPQALMFGSILAATDPVAVVGILKELGASPKLTMCVSGESLLNDGTAIVMFKLFSALSLGTKEAFKEAVGYDEFGAFLVIKYFCWVALGGVIMGAGFGLVAVMIIANFKRRTMHTDILIQVTITLVLAYLTFFISETVAGVSGVLATVSCALVFAGGGWPHFVDREAMESFWHMIEYILNTVIFVLAGAIMGYCFGEDVHHFRHLNWIDLVYLILLYVAMLAIRGTMVVCLYPFLSRMGYTLDWRDAFMLTWGGLRGALGLALAVDVDMVYTRLGHEGSVFGSRVVFHVGGFAMLTLLINGVSCSYFLSILGMIGSDKYQDALTAHVETRVEAQCEKVLDERARELLRSGEDFSGYRQRVLERVQVLQHVEAAMAPTISVASSVGQSNRRNGSSARSSSIPFFGKSMRVSLAEYESRLTALRHLFLAMLRGRYMELIDQGILEAQGQVVIILMNSVDAALGKAHKKEKLCDWEVVAKGCRSGTRLNSMLDCTEQRLPNWFLRHSPFHLRVILENAGLSIRSHTVCYLLLCFIHAHRKNQENIKELLSGASPNSFEARDLATIVDESKHEEEAACALLASMDELLVQDAKVSLLTNTVLEGERVFIMQLVREGALKEKQAHHLLESIGHNLTENAKRLGSRSSLVADYPSRSSLVPPRHGCNQESELSTNWRSN